MEETQASAVPPAGRENPPSNRSAGVLLVAGLVFIAAFAVRLPLSTQSLWYDELYTMKEYVHQPLRKAISGEYSPNNHVLHTLACKAVNFTAVRVGLLRQGPPTAVAEPDSLPVFSEPLLRLVSLLAGSLVGVALAWPLREKHPLVALALALVTCFNPWMIGFSTEARGYSLMLLLCILATNSLPTRPAGYAWKYIFAMTAALYTVPVCLPIVFAHGLTMFLLQRDAFAAWFRSAILVVAIAIALYLPMAGGMVSYYKLDLTPTVSYRQFLREVWSTVHAGRYMPQLPQMLIGIAAIVLGGAAAWQRREFRPALATFGIAAVIGLLAPIILHTYGEVRFMSWLIPLYAIGVTAALTAVLPTLMRIAQAGMAVLLVVWLAMCWSDLDRIPKQPIREGVQEARRLAGPDRYLIGVYLAAAETGYSYDNINDVAYRVRPAGRDSEPAPYIQDAEARARRLNAEPWLIALYDSYFKAKEPGLYAYVQEHYQVVRTLQGRISTVAIYKPRPGWPPASDKRPTTASP